MWKVFLTVLPTVYSTTIALTRVRDYHHHFSDILGGSVLGSLLAIFAYMLNYHPLTGTKSHLPKSRRDARAVYYLEEPIEEVSVLEV